MNLNQTSVFIEFCKLHGVDPQGEEAEDFFHDEWSTTENNHGVCLECGNESKYTIIRNHDSIPIGNRWVILDTWEIDGTECCGGAELYDASGSVVEIDDVPIDDGF